MQTTIDSPGQLFDLFGLDKESFQRLPESEPQDGAEQELLARLLMRLPQIKLRQIERWTNRPIAWDDVATRPGKYQRQFLGLDGNVSRVTRIIPSDEIQSRFALDSYYRCQLTLGDRLDAVVFARSVPKKWQIDTPINEPASASAVFLNAGSQNATQKSELYFAADRIAWHPETPLGTAGMDYGLFDSVRQLKPITNDERECFYQMLVAAKRAAGKPMLVNAVDSVSQLGRLMSNPQAHLGEPCTFRGIARCAIRIHITDPDTVARLGFDHYFEVVFFLDLEGVADVAGQKVTTFPIVCVLRSLPLEMPIGEHIAEPVQVTGFMFKKWPYATQMTEEKNRDLKVASPLLIGDSLIWEPHAVAPSSMAQVAGGVIISMIALIGLGAWWLHRREQRARKSIADKRSSLLSSESLNSLNFDSEIDIKRS